MASVVLLLLILSFSLASNVGAFSTHRCRGKLPVRLYPGRGIATQTTSLRQSNSGGEGEEDVVITAPRDVANFPIAKRAYERLVFTLPVATPSFPFLETYVSRPALENMILEVYNSRSEDIYGAYTVLVGLEGSGKKSTTAHALDKKPGVVYLPVSAADTRVSLVRKILNTSGEVIEDHAEFDTSIFYLLLEQVARRLDDRPLMVVLDLDSSACSSDRVLFMVASVAKSLARGASVVVVLADAHAGLVIDFDPRQRFVWVDGMTHEEGAAYAKQVFPAVADADLELFFDKVGAFPCRSTNQPCILKSFEFLLNFFTSRKPF
jgi:hypothetical protein